MRKAILLVSLSLAANAFAARIDLPPRETALEMVDSPEKANALRDAFAVFTLADGSQWVTHGAPAQREPGPAAVTRLGRDGSVRTFPVSDWLPATGTGQAYGVAMLDDGRVALSGGWNDGHASHNGIVVLRAAAGGRYTAETMFEVPGVAQIAGAPGNTILAVTSDATRRGGGPLLTLYDIRGRTVASHFDRDGSMSPSDAVQTAKKAHLRRIDGTRFALYDPVLESVVVFELTGGVFRHSREIVVRDETSPPVLGIDVSDDGDIVVARVGLVRGSPGTQLTLYGTDGLAKQSAVVDRPWNHMFREENRIRGVVLRNGVGLDSVSLRREQ